MIYAGLSPGCTTCGPGLCDLVADCEDPDPHRDDVELSNTMTNGLWPGLNLLQTSDMMMSSAPNYQSAGGVGQYQRELRVGQDWDREIEARSTELQLCGRLFLSQSASAATFRGRSDKRFSADSPSLSFHPLSSSTIALGSSARSGLAGRGPSTTVRFSRASTMPSSAALDAGGTLAAHSAPATRAIGSRAQVAQSSNPFQPILRG